MHTDLIARLRVAADVAEETAGLCGDDVLAELTANPPKTVGWPWDDYTARLARQAARYANRALDLRAAADLLARSCEGCRYRVPQGSEDGCRRLSVDCDQWVACWVVGHSCGQWEATCRE